MRFLAIFSAFVLGFTAAMILLDSRMAELNSENLQLRQELHVCDLAYGEGFDTAIKECPI